METNPNPTEAAVRDRYSRAARQTAETLCCPIEYDQRYLAIIPAEVIERDYGCGDPSRYVREGETVLDLGSGTGKICFITAQIVGARGRVIGVDMTDAMLAVARRNAPIVAERLGYANVDFRKGRIQDLALDLERFDAELAALPASATIGSRAACVLADGLRARAPMIPDQSVDVVVSNCVLNLVEPKSKTKLFDEIFRVLRPGGRAVISDIVAGAPVPEELRADAHLWSGCIAGALTESDFLRAFVNAGFNGVRRVKRSDEPWQTVQGIDFRSVTVNAVKGEGAAAGEGAGPPPCCGERNAICGP